MSAMQSKPIPPELRLAALETQVKGLHQTVAATVNLLALVRMDMENRCENLRDDANPRMHDHAQQVEDWAAQIELLTNALADSTWDRVGHVVRPPEGDVA